ncbi:MAG: SRPBCC family protein [Bdellovibrionales bacterium]|nr:SRPBCC family protein [Bdellovibrionales bacterium]
MAKKIGIALGTFILLILAVAAVKSPDYVVSRSVFINAPAEKIFPYLNNQRLAEKWGSWMEMDPDSKMSYSGPDEGVGAKGSWTGGKKMGTGSATIVNTVPNERVDIKLEYTEPMDMVQDSEYLITPEGTGSKVSWTVRGKNNLLGRLMCLFADIDKMIGPMFEKGLSNLKTLIETAG